MSKVSGRDILLGVLTFSMLCVVIKIVTGSTSVDPKQGPEGPPGPQGPPAPLGATGIPGLSPYIVTGPVANSLKINQTGGLYYTIPAFAYLYSSSLDSAGNIVWKSFTSSNISLSTYKIILGPIGVYEITCSGMVKNKGNNASPSITMTGSSLLTYPNIWYLSGGPPIGGVSGYAFNVNFNTMTKTTVINTPISFSITNVELWEGYTPMYLTIKYVSL